ncbi:MAG: (2Fe-2S)-binding protein [Solirubrobacterales bacterium]|nr:(2Fe-2S)-binding protein [Solirubrobacterales bacterium]
MDRIDQTLGRIRVASADGYGVIIRRRSGPGDGWFSAGELDGSGRVQALLLSRISGMAGPPEDHIRAEWLLESLSRTVADLGSSFMVAARQLPELSPANVLLAAEGGLLRASGLTSNELFESDRPEDLADRFRASFVELMEPTITWLDAQGLRPAKTLWHSASDRFAQSMVWAGKAFDRPELALELTMLTVGPESPDPRLAIEIKRAEDDWGEEYHLRNTCCLAYRTPGGQLCQSCPLSGPA